MGVQGDDRRTDEAGSERDVAGVADEAVRGGGAGGEGKCRKRQLPIGGSECSTDDDRELDIAETPSPPATAGGASGAAHSSRRLRRRAQLAQPIRRSRKRLAECVTSSTIAAAPTQTSGSRRVRTSINAAGTRTATVAALTTATPGAVAAARPRPTSRRRSPVRSPTTLADTRSGAMSGASADRAEAVGPDESARFTDRAVDDRTPNSTLLVARVPPGIRRRRERSGIATPACSPPPLRSPRRFRPLASSLTPQRGRRNRAGGTDDRTPTVFVRGRGRNEHRVRSGTGPERTGSGGAEGADGPVEEPAQKVVELVLGGGVCIRATSESSSVMPSNEPSTRRIAFVDCRNRSSAPRRTGSARPVRASR